MLSRTKVYKATDISKEDRRLERDDRGNDSQPIDTSISQMWAVDLRSIRKFRLKGTYSHNSESQRK